MLISHLIIQVITYIYFHTDSILTTLGWLKASIALPYYCHHVHIKLKSTYCVQRFCKKRSKYCTQWFHTGHTDLPTLCSSLYWCGLLLLFHTLANSVFNSPSLTPLFSGHTLLHTVGEHFVTYWGEHFVTYWGGQLCYKSQMQSKVWKNLQRMLSCHRKPRIS